MAGGDDGTGDDAGRELVAAALAEPRPRSPASTRALERAISGGRSVAAIGVVLVTGALLLLTWPDVLVPGAVGLGFGGTLAFGSRWARRRLARRGLVVDAEVLDARAGRLIASVMGSTLEAYVDPRILDDATMVRVLCLPDDPFCVVFGARPEIAKATWTVGPRTLPDARLVDR